MERYKQRQFVYDLQAAVTKQLIAHDERWPEAWGEAELRELVATAYTQQRTLRGDAMRICRDQIIARGLLDARDAVARRAARWPTQEVGR